MAWLEQCDLFIAEVSGSSFGLEFETGNLLGATNKESYCFTGASLSRGFLFFITRNTHANCTLVPYATRQK